MEEYIKRIVDLCADQMDEYVVHKDLLSMWISWCTIFGNYKSKRK
jgi:hypothetical protein